MAVQIGTHDDDNYYDFTDAQKLEMLIIFHKQLISMVTACCCYDNTCC